MAMDTQKAFNILKGELREALSQLSEKGTQAFGKEEFTSAQTAAQQAKIIKKYLHTLESLHENWGFVVKGITTKKSNKSAKKRKHLSPGLKTPETDFWIPMLKAILELGGAGATQDVIDLVGRKMADQLNDYDREILRSGHEKRWRNTVKWARNNMVDEGLLRDDSPYGTWEISKKGRVYLEENEE